MTQNQQKMDLRVYDCGVSPYRDVLKLQHDMARHRWQEKIGNTVLIVEHPPVITLGARESENKLLVDKDTLSEKEISLVRVKRGGGTTAHNPGQIVLYPIIKLKSLNLSVTDYIRELEEVGIELLAGLGIESRRKKGFPGLWIEDRKIASIGVQIQRWVTMHGLAINIQNDLSIFDNMVPCGIEHLVMTSVMVESGQENDMAQVKGRLKELCVTHWTRT